MWGEVISIQFFGIFLNFAKSLSSSSVRQLARIENV